MRFIHMALALASLFAVPAETQVSADITLTHNGTNAEFLALSRSFVKVHLQVINDRTGGKVNPDTTPGQPPRIPWTEADADGASAARITKGVAIIVQDFYEKTSHAYELGVATRQADLDIVTPVRDRPDQTSVDTDFDP